MDLDRARSWDYVRVIVWPSFDTRESYQRQISLLMKDLSGRPASLTGSALFPWGTAISMWLSPAITAVGSLSTQGRFIWTKQAGIAWPDKSFSVVSARQAGFRGWVTQQHHLPLPAPPPPYTCLHPSPWPTVSPLHILDLVCVQWPSGHCVPKRDPSLSHLSHSGTHAPNHSPHKYPSLLSAQHVHQKVSSNSSLSRSLRHPQNDSQILSLPPGNLLLELLQKEKDTVTHPSLESQFKHIISV